MEFLHDILDQPNAAQRDQLDDDDDLYAELERRILLLINTADDKDDSCTNSNSKHSPVRSRSGYSYGSPQRDQRYFDWTESESSGNSSVPTGILNLWRSNNVNIGTGVFIPHMVKSKKKNKPRRKNNDKGRAIYKAVANKS